MPVGLAPHIISGSNQIEPDRQRATALERFVAGWPVSGLADGGQLMHLSYHAGFTRLILSSQFVQQSRFEGHSEPAVSMLIHLYKHAATTPKVRAATLAWDKPVAVLAERFGTTVQTVCKCRHRGYGHGPRHTPYHLQTSLNLTQGSGVE